MNLKHYIADDENGKKERKEERKNFERKL